MGSSSVISAHRLFIIRTGHLLFNNLDGLLSLGLGDRLARAREFDENLIKNYLTLIRGGRQLLATCDRLLDPLFSVPCEPPRLLEFGKGRNPVPLAINLNDRFAIYNRIGGKSRRLLWRVLLVPILTLLDKRLGVLHVPSDELIVHRRRPLGFSGPSRMVPLAHFVNDPTDHTGVARRDARLDRNTSPL